MSVDKMTRSEIRGHGFSVGIIHRPEESILYSCINKEYGTRILVITEAPACRGLWQRLIVELDKMLGLGTRGRHAQVDKAQHSTIGWRLPETLSIYLYKGTRLHIQSTYMYKNIYIYKHTNIYICMCMCIQICIDMHM